MKKTKNKKPRCSEETDQYKAVESVLRPERSLRWERFVEKVGLEPGVKERSYGCESWSGSDNRIAPETTVWLGLPLLDHQHHPRYV